MKTYRFLCIVVVLLAVSFMSCSKKSPTNPATTINVGSIGPGGGYIFYDKGSYSNGWRYLEAAPASSEFTATWGLYGIACPGTATGIGTGRANTTAIINLLNANGETGKATQLCTGLDINGYTDWFLPSKDELNEMYLRLRVGNNIGGFNLSGNIYSNGYPGWYWSSSVYYGDGDSSLSQYCTWEQRFSDGYQVISNNYGGYNYRPTQLSVRAVRAF